MDRGAWQATVYGLARAGQDLTKPPAKEAPESDLATPTT